MFTAKNCRSFGRIIVWAMLLLVIFQSAALACPTCKDSLDQNDPSRANMVRGYFWSILFMMSMPFLILGGLCLMFYLEVRKAKARQAEEIDNDHSETTMTPAS